MEKLCCLLLFSVMLVPGCKSNKAIRGGEAVDKYDISKIDLPLEEIHYKNLDGADLYAWFIKNKDYHQAPTIIFLHGSRGNIFSNLPVITNLYRNVGANIFACDFPGTGASRGAMSLKNTYQMTLAALEYAENMPDIRHDKIALYGVSMGAALAFYGASKRELVPVIVDSGVTSAADYMRRCTFIGLPDFLIGLFGENFNNYSLVRSMKNPKLFLHGKRDPVIDIRHAQRLYDRASGPKDFLWIEGGHVLFGDPRNSRALSDKIGAFLGEYLPE